MFCKARAVTPAYIKNDNLLNMSPLKVPTVSVYVKGSLTSSQNQRNTSLIKKVHVFGTLCMSGLCC